jgi:hypothetical protein
MLIKPIAYWQGAVVGTTPAAQQFIFLNGYNFYQWKGTRLGLAGTGGIAKIDLTGSLDTTWASNANPSTQTEVRFSVPLNGNMYGDTRNSSGGNQIKKWNATGSIIASSSVGSSVWAMNAREGSTFFMITGDRGVTYGGTGILGVGKINEDLTRDTTFTTNVGTGPQGGTTPAAGFVNAAFVSSNRIGVSGAFTSWNGNSSYDKFVVLNYDGTRDTGFARTGAFNANVVPMIFIDNKWIVGGAFTSYNSITQNYIMAFNTDGSVDTTFTTNIGTGFNGSVSSITRVSDTQIVVTGTFTTLNGETRNRVALLNTDGTIPSNIFGTGFASAPPYVTLDNTGKYYIVTSASSPTTYNGYTSRNFFPINADGSINSSFVTGSAMQVNGTNSAEPGGVFAR